MKGKRVKEVPKSVRAGVPGEADLLVAVQRFVELNGGKLVVIGGISLQEWPQDNKGVFHVAVRCLGRKPDELELKIKTL